MPAALERVSALARVPMLRSFVGLRPHVPDGRPIIGRTSVPDNLLIAAGHDGDGISLSDVTGKIIADLATAREPAVDVTSVSPDRFRAPR